MTTAELIDSIRETFPRLSRDEQEEFFLAIDQLRLEALLNDSSDSASDSIDV
jgi:hypothetical protein